MSDEEETTAEAVEAVEAAAGIDDADVAAGYRSILDPDGLADLPAGDPNIAVCDSTPDAAGEETPLDDEQRAIDAALEHLRATYGPDGPVGLQVNGVM